MTKKLLRFSGFCILACLTIYLSSCKTTEIILHGHLTGTVSDNENNDPVQGAFVELVSEDQSTLTDSLGNYELRNIDPDDHFVKASADGYFENENYVRIVEAQVNIQDFSLERSGIALFPIDSLEFGFESDTLAFYLSNTGKEQMNYSFVPSEPWISIDPDAGFLDVSDSVAVTVSIDRTDLGNSTHEELLQISTVNGNDDLDLFVNRVMDMDTNFYSVVEIYDQIWMAENLNVGTRINVNPPYASMLDVPDEEEQWETNNIIEKYCYENLESNCDNYGGLYMWWEAMQWWGGENVPSPIGPTQGICPEGWHIPTLSDWGSLIDALGGLENAAYKLTEGCKSCPNPDPSPNITGFSSLLRGRLNLLGVGWTPNGDSELYLSDSKDATTFIQAFYIGCVFNNETYPLQTRIVSNGSQDGNYVRCIKDP